MPKYYDIRGPVKDSKMEKHAQMCQSTLSVLESCFESEGSSMSEAKEFPKVCADVAVTHMECTLRRKEFAYETALQLAGNEAVAKVIPHFEESKKKTLELMEVYKQNVAGGKAKDTFWG